MTAKTNKKNISVIRTNIKAQAQVLNTLLSEKAKLHMRQCLAYGFNDEGNIYVLENTYDKDIEDIDNQIEQGIKTLVELRQELRELEYGNQEKD